MPSLPRGARWTGLIVGLTIAVVIATVRNGQPAPDAVTALWKDGLLRRLELQPLSRSESDQLLRTALGSPPDRDCADRLWRLTAGNVLFLRQLVEQEQRAAIAALQLVQSEVDADVAQHAGATSRSVGHARNSVTRSAMVRGFSMWTKWPTPSRMTQSA